LRNLISILFLWSKLSFWERFFSSFFNNKTFSKHASILFKRWMNLKTQIDEYIKIEHMLDVLYGNGMQAFTNNNILNRTNWKEWSVADVVWKKDKF